MKKIILESAPELVVLCIVAGLVYAFVEYYKNKHQPWSKTLNWILFGLRAVVATFLAFLLLGPIIKHINNTYDKPRIVFLFDHSASVAEVTDSTKLNNLNGEIKDLQQDLENNGFTTSIYNLQGEVNTELKFNAPSSDLNSGLKQISNRYEGQNLDAVVLISDGIYNAGLSPVYASYNFPVHTIGIGDTTVRMDVGIRNVAFNKLAYEGNRFPIRAEIQTKNLPAQNIKVTLRKKGKIVDEQIKKSTGDDDLLTYDFQPLAEEQGIQKYDVEVEIKSGEYNTRNNRASAFVEVVEGKKKILLVAPAPHPDIKALREVIEKNSNYDFTLHIPGVSKTSEDKLKPTLVDLAIFHQSPDMRGRTASLFQTFSKSNTSLLVVLGQQSDLRELSKHPLPVKFENIPREFDEVTPVVNSVFSNFTINKETNTIVNSYPPAFVHFGKLQLVPGATTVLFQKVGNITTEKPLLAVADNNNRKTGIMLGDGLWRWRLNEFERTEKTEGFDEIFGKLIQYLSTTDDKRKFRSYPVKQEFSDTEPVVFESQVYNDIFEPVYGNTISISITDESGKKSDYSYVTSQGNIRYQVGGLKEEVYKYRSSTSINGKTEEVKGEFAIVHQQAELQNLTADFDLLKKLSQNTGGKFYNVSEIENFKTDLSKLEPKAIIHSEENFDYLINLKWLFFLLLTLISMEWFLRKYHGSY